MAMAADFGQFLSTVLSSGAMDKTRNLVVAMALARSTASVHGLAYLFKGQIRKRFGPIAHHRSGPGWANKTKTTEYGQKRKDKYQQLKPRIIVIYAKLA
jgi:hypothetical protein